ncbi:hypothetical protein GCM10010371_65960 [Streptomyces subrutilus]|uniref:Uncharacterized protein n=1 Tax=Streptomyces subrutilus TaxID=36818 RepID=A0A918VHL8_9ACTN|nr:hypothetical protein [Streptomyces subrutilus]GGZ96842.1 hypothetical protein GCM10010371_65960 [Streptomyces subrutilus]
MSTEKWTADHLRVPANRAIHVEQRRRQLLPVVDDLRRLAREVEALVGEIDTIEGDVPGQAWVRARRVTRPLYKAADDVEKAIGDLVAFNARYERSYEELPAKRAKQREEREEKRRRKLSAKGVRPAIGSAEAGEPAARTDQFDDVFSGLRKGA